MKTFVYIFQELIDSTKTKMSALAQQYENEVDSGINIEIAKQILREEDQFDKKRFREKIREKHKEEKRKLKAKKMKANDEEEKDVSSSNEEIDVGNDDVNEDESDEGPDTSWLPDPDKIYGKQRNTDEEISSVNESEENESEKESVVHR